MGLAECSSWLYEKLKTGKRFSYKEIKAEAKENGFSMTDLRVAKINLEVKTYHQFPTVDAKEDWLWYMEV